MKCIICLAYKLTLKDTCHISSFFSIFSLLLLIYASENIKVIHNIIQIHFIPSRPKLSKIQTSIII